MKKKGGKVTLEDINRAKGGFSRDFIAKNPHLLSPASAALPPSASFEPEKAAPEPKTGKTRKIRRSPEPKTRPEREMAMILMRKLAQGEFHSFGFESMTIEVGSGLRYTPDFTIWNNDGTLRFIEVKGPYIRRTGLQVYQAGKKAYPKAVFELWQLDGGNWTQLD